MSMALHHITVLPASVKKISTTRAISVGLSKNLTKDGTLAKGGRFTPTPNIFTPSNYGEILRTFSGFSDQSFFRFSNFHLSLRISIT